MRIGLLIGMNASEENEVLQVPLRWQYSGKQGRMEFALHCV